MLILTGAVYGDIQTLHRVFCVVVWENGFLKKPKGEILVFRVFEKIGKKKKHSALLLCSGGHDGSFLFSIFNVRKIW